MKLFMILLGCTPPGRNTEQHDIFFGIAESIKSLAPSMIEAWPEASGKIHIDAWRQINYVDGCSVHVVNREQTLSIDEDKKKKLFFLNLGGYKKNEFEEYHYKMIVACENKSVAIQAAKQTAFYKHTGFTGATSHIDDKYGVDVDDVFEIEDILPVEFKNKYRIVLSQTDNPVEDILNIGYYKLTGLI